MVVRLSVTAERFERLAANMGSCELVRGEVVPMSPGGMPHSRVSLNIGSLLWNWARKSRRGRVIGNEAGLITQRDPDTVRGADVAFCSYKRLPRDTPVRGFLAVPPELVVEVLGVDRTWKEAVEKAGEYLRMGVERMWIVDPSTRRVHVYRADDEPAVLGARALLRDQELLPGFAVRVGEFFRD